MCRQVTYSWGIILRQLSWVFTHQILILVLKSCFPPQNRVVGRKPNTKSTKFWRREGVTSRDTWLGWSWSMRGGKSICNQTYNCTNTTYIPPRTPPTTPPPPTTPTPTTRTAAVQGSEEQRPPFHLSVTGRTAASWSKIQEDKALISANKQHSDASGYIIEGSDNYSTICVFLNENFNPLLSTQV